jgi:hypothetical protein
MSFTASTLLTLGKLKTEGAREQKGGTERMKKHREALGAWNTQQ